jgi:hypothetical protein
MRIRDDGLVGINETSPSAQLQVKSGATTRVPLVITTEATSGFTANLASFSANGAERIFFENNGNIRTRNGLSNYTTSNWAYINVGDNGTLIQRNVADTNPALIVNLANASATGNIQVWQKSGVAVASINGSGYISGRGISNNTAGSNAFVATEISGTTISRNIADSNPALIVNQQNASSTGKILSFRFNGVEKSYIDKDGNFSGASVQPTYTSLGSRAGSAGDGTITVTDITTYDELIVDLVYDGGANGRSFRTQAPVSTHFQPSGAGDLNGITVVGVEKGGTTLVSATVSQNTNTLLDVDFGGTVTDYVVYVYGVNW